MLDSEFLRKIKCSRWLRSLWLLMALFCYRHGHCQYDQVWAFGVNAGLDFNGNPPRPLTTAITTSEGSASVCDSNGRLLFYTEGSQVWDRNHQLMPNGSNLTGKGEDVTRSTTQGSLIVPAPGNRDRYFVFSLGAIESGGSGELWYSIVDMQLNGGRGDIVAGAKGIQIGTGHTEKLLGIPGNDCNVWIVTVPQRGNQVKIFNITAEGLDTLPKMYEAHRFTAGSITGWLDASPDRSKIFLDSRLYSFDSDKGALGHSIFAVSEHPYGVCFSPDNTKLYLAFGNLGFFQYDISSMDSVKITASRYRISDRAGALRRGPDRKIYVSGIEFTTLGLVYQPDLPAAACHFAPFAIHLDGGSTGISFPNYVPVPQPRYRNLYSRSIDKVFCIPTHEMTATGNTGSNYIWTTGDTLDRVDVQKSGTYWVQYNIHSLCGYDQYTDTFYVYFDTLPRQKKTIQHRALYCKDDTLTLFPAVGGGHDYLWNTGFRAEQISVKDTGMYWVIYRSDSSCMIYTDSFRVNYTTVPYLGFDLDTLTCSGQVVDVVNRSDSIYQHFTWDMGDGTQLYDRDVTYTYRKNGHYQVTLRGYYGFGCMDSLKKHIAVDAVDTLAMILSRNQICQGETVTFAPQVPLDRLVQLDWSINDQQLLRTLPPAPVSHAFAQAGMTYIRLDARFRACPDLSCFDSIWVERLPLVDLGPDRVLCTPGNTLELYNQLAGQPGDTYNWSNGDTTVVSHIQYPGSYRLRVTNKDGCVQEEEIMITKGCYLDIPNAFSPNADGRNDYFLPRQNLGHGLNHFEMTIFDRWGKILFRTTTIYGRGWDGTYNGIAQTPGVYVYKITFDLENGHSEQYQGNVTLLR